MTCQVFVFCRHAIYFRLVTANNNEASSHKRRYSTARPDKFESVTVYMLMVDLDADNSWGESIEFPFVKTARSRVQVTLHVGCEQRQPHEPSRASRQPRESLELRPESVSFRVLNRSRRATLPNLVSIETNRVDAAPEP